MEARIVKWFVNAMTWLLIGMVLMARRYFINLGITSGAMYIGWDTVAFVIGGLFALQAIIKFDPSFKAPTWDQEHAEDHYDAYGVNTKNSFNTPPKG